MVWTKPMPAHPVVAVAGATGAVGREFLKVLHDLDFPASEIRLLASARSAGTKLPFEGCGSVPAGSYAVEEMTPESFAGVDIALFSAGSGVSQAMRCQLPFGSKQSGSGIHNGNPRKRAANPNAPSPASLQFPRRRAVFPRTPRRHPTRTPYAGSARPRQPGRRPPQATTGWATSISRGC